MTAEDLEKIIAEQEREERERAKKRKANQARSVGEYTVKVLNQRPKLQKWW